MTLRTCSNCLYYDSTGICRYFPPQVVVEAPNPVTLWPVVAATDWCGRHEFSSQITFQQSTNITRGGGAVKT